MNRNGTFLTALFSRKTAISKTETQLYVKFFVKMVELVTQ